MSLCCGHTVTTHTCDLAGIHLCWAIANAWRSKHSSLDNHLATKPAITFLCRSPEAMMQEVWRCPSPAALAGLKECLDFGASTWIALFARLGGAELLLQVL